MPRVFDGVLSSVEASIARRELARLTDVCALRLLRRASPKAPLAHTAATRGAGGAGRERPAEPAHDTHRRETTTAAVW